MARHRMATPILLFLLITALSLPAQDAGPNSFSVIGAWRIEKSGAGADLQVKDAKLDVTYDVTAPAPRDKCMLSSSMTLDLSNKKSVVLTVKKTLDVPASLALAVGLADNKYYESQPIALRTGENKDIVFDLTASSFKCADSGWAYTRKAEGLDKARRLYLLVYAKGQGQVIFSDFRLVAGDGNQVVPAPQPVKRMPDATSPPPPAVATTTGTQQPVPGREVKVIPPPVPILEEKEQGPLLPVKKNSKWGYVSLDGKMVIEPKFDAAMPFSEERALVCIEDKWAFIDLEGKYISLGRYEGGRAFQNGLAAVKNGGKWGFVDKKGQELIKPRFDAALEFSDAMACVKDGGKWGYINELGRFVILPQYEEAGSFSENLAGVRKDDKWGYVNKKGDYVVVPQLLNAGKFSGGLAAVEIEKGWGYIDRAGKLTIMPIYDHALNFSEGLAGVMINDLWGYVNEDGTFIIDPQFDMAGEFTDGIAAIMMDGKWGYVSDRGELLIKPRFDFGKSFHQGAALIELLDVTDEGLVPYWGYIDTAGAYIWRPSN